MRSRVEKVDVLGWTKSAGITAHIHILFGDQNAGVMMVMSGVHYSESCVAI